MDHLPFLRYYIKVTDPNLLDAMLASIDSDTIFETQRDGSLLTLRVADQAVWESLYLYGQMLAQAQDAFIEAGQD